MGLETNRRWLLVIIAGAFVIRVGWGLAQPPTIDQRLPDQAEYFSLAQNLLREHALKFYDDRFGDEVYAFRTPGYPLFLAACGANVRLARVAQAGLDASTALAIYLLARRWLRIGASLLAAGLVALNPFLIYFSGLILSETLFTAMLAWGLVLLVWKPNVVWGGIVLALSILVRPGAVGLPVVLGVAAVLARGRQWGSGEVAITEAPRFSWPVGATMVALTLLVLAPWAVRNHALLGEWVWLTSNGGVTKYDGFNPDATGASDQRFLTSLQMRGLREIGELQRDEYLSELADRWIRETCRTDKTRLFKLTLTKIGRLWSPVPLSAEFGGRALYKVVAMGWAIPFYALIVLGLWKGNLSTGSKWLLLTAAVYFTIVHALSVGSLRYRVPVEPVLAVLAAAGAAVLFDQAKRPGWKREQGSNG